MNHLSSAPLGAPSSTTKGRAFPQLRTFAAFFAAGVLAACSGDPSRRLEQEQKQIENLLGRSSYTPENTEESEMIDFQEGRANWFGHYLANSQYLFEEAQKNPDSTPETRTSTQSELARMKVEIERFLSGYDSHTSDFLRARMWEQYQLQINGLRGIN